MSLPKVLILGQPFDDFTGGGITLSNLFSGWRKEDLSVACIPHMLERVNKSCENYYQLGEKEHKWVFPFNLVQRKFSSGPLKQRPVNDYPGSVQKNKTRASLVDHLFYPFLIHTGLIHSLSKIKPSREFYQWVDHFKPEILYIQVSARKDFSFCETVYGYLKIPMVIHIMDDWPSTISNKGLFKKYWFRKIDSEFRSLLDKASLLLTISDQMSEEYNKRYQNKFIAFHNPVDISRWKEFQKTSSKLQTPPSFLYAGRIGIGIDSSLISIAKAIQNINDELKMGIKFIVQTKETANWFMDFDCVQHKNFVAYADVPKALSSADFLVLPYDFSEESELYIKYSMPTKAPEYMVSGIPILIFAPVNTALVRFAKMHDVAMIVTENNLTDLSNAIKELILNETKRITISENARKVAEENFDSAKIKMEFEHAINEIRVS